MGDITIDSRILQSQKNKSRRLQRKKVRHDTWIHRARMLSATSNKHTDLENSLTSTEIQQRFPDAQPQCTCTDDSDRCLCVVPKRCKNGQYQIRTLCYFCLREGKKICAGTRSERRWTRMENSRYYRALTSCIRRKTLNASVVTKTDITN